MNEPKPSQTSEHPARAAGPAATPSPEPAITGRNASPTPKPDHDVMTTIDDLRREMAELKAAVGKLPPKSSKEGAAGIVTFFSSGLFFMLVGGLILLLAFKTMASAYAIFSFVLVVLGVAMLLFGTGTQSMGEFASDSAATKYKLQLAGGAGVLAFAVAYGIAFYSTQMKQAFQIERKYFVLQIKPKADGTSSFDGYAPVLSIAGSPIPVMKRGDFVIAYVPYVESEKDKTWAIAYELRITETASRNKALRWVVKDFFSVDIAGKLDQRDGAFDFPVYSVIQEIDMKSTENAQEILKSSGTNPDVPIIQQDPQTPPPSIPPASGA